jgi:hypothetical protein
MSIARGCRICAGEQPVSMRTRGQLTLSVTSPTHIMGRVQYTTLSIGWALDREWRHYHAPNRCCSKIRQDYYMALIIWKETASAWNRTRGALKSLLQPGADRGVGNWGSCPGHQERGAPKKEPAPSKFQQKGTFPIVVPQISRLCPIRGGGGTVWKSCPGHQKP